MAQPTRRRGCLAAFALLAAALALVVSRARPRNPAPEPRPAPDVNAEIRETPAGALLQTLYRNGVVRLDAPRPILAKVAALSSGAITPFDAPETPFGHALSLDPQTAVLVAGTAADDSLAAAAAMGISLRRLPAAGLGTILIPNSNQPGDEGDICGLYICPDGTNGLRLVAWASEAWVRQALARVGEPGADDYARLAAAAPNSLFLLRHMLGRTEGRAAEVLLARIRLLSTPAIGAPATFGDRVEWRGARLLGDDAPATNGLLRIRHYWHIPANASRLFGRLSASLRLRRGGTELADDFTLGPETALVTADDPERDSLLFVTDREVNLGAQPPGTAWSLEVGVADKQGGDALRAASDLPKAKGRRVLVDDPITVPDSTYPTDPPHTTPTP